MRTEAAVRPAVPAAAGAHSLNRTIDEHVRPVTDATTHGRIHGEFEHQAALILGIDDLLQDHPEILAQIIAAVHDRIKIIGVVADDDRQRQAIALLRANHLPVSCVDFFHWPVAAMCMRDYGPFFVVGEHATVVDFAYPEHNRDLEDDFNVAFAATFHLHYDHSHLTLEGGNLLSNGDGMCVSTTKLRARNMQRGYDEQQTGGFLHDHFHFNRWVHLEPLDDEPTGHVDTFLTLPATNKAILGFYRLDDDPVNALILDRNATVLKGEATKKGPLEVLRIPMPSHRDGVWRTYTSVIYANGVVLVPQYPDTNPDLDRVALGVYHEALPDWKVIGIDCSRLTSQRGALHSVSRQVPTLNHAP